MVVFYLTTPHLTSQSLKWPEVHLTKPHPNFINRKRIFSSAKDLYRAALDSKFPRLSHLPIYLSIVLLTYLLISLVAFFLLLWLGSATGHRPYIPITITFH